MICDWTRLDAELDRLTAPLPFWWRDDDAVADTPQLTRLIALSEQTQVPVHLAIIPARADTTLPPRLDPGWAVPVTHGWAHKNHAPKGEKRAEFGAHRPLEMLEQEAAQARLHLADLLGTAPAPMFVPPWNRMTRSLAPGLKRAGFDSLSTFTPRRTRAAAPGLTQINTHIDPIDWRGTRSLVDPQQLIAQMVQQLADRRLGNADPTEPYGLLTHHLVHDEAIWGFTAALLTRLRQAPLTLWRADTPPKTET